jgi:hypothetical protein
LLSALQSQGLAFQSSIRAVEVAIRAAALDGFTAAEISEACASDEALIARVLAGEKLIDL